MFLCIILTIIIASIFIYITIGDVKNIGSKFLSLIISSGLSFLISFLLLIAISTIFINSPNLMENYLDHTDYIVSIKNDKDINGSFIFGSGNIATCDKYAYFCKQEDGSIIRKEIDASITSIIEGCDLQNARVEYYYDKVNKKSFHRYFILVFLFEKRLTHCIIYVPTGTVIKQFNIE